METKQIISWLLDKAARAQDHSYARMLNMAAKRLQELDQKQWNEICNIEDLPREDGEYLVALHSIGDFFGEPDEKEIVASAYFHFEQKTWEVTPYSYINALLPVFDLFDTMTTDYITHWMPLPKPPKEVDHES